MNTHNEMENIFNTNQEMFPVININIELSLNSFMNVDACFHTNLIILRIPVSFISDWHTFPSLWIHSSESFATEPNNSLGENVWFLVQVMVICIWVVESSYRNGVVNHTNWLHHVHLWKNHRSRNSCSHDRSL